MDSQSKILMLIYFFHPIIGGAERQCLLQAKTLRAAGHSVMVLTTWHRGLKLCEEMDGIPVYRMIFELPLFPFRRISLFLSIVLFLIWNWKKYDVVHVHQFNALVIAACVAKLLTRKGVLCKQACEKPYSGFDLLEKSHFSSLFYWLIRHQLDFFLAISKATYREAEEHGFQEQLRYLPNGVLISDWHWSNAESTNILFIGRLHPQKGADIFIRASVLDTSPKNCYILLGDGPLRGELKRQAPGNVVFEGNVSNPEKWLEKPGTFFVLPSRAEGLSNALLEAMARGVPSIASSAVSGSSDLAGKKVADFPGYSVYENLILTEPESPQAVHDAICYLQSRKQEVLTMSASCKTFIISNYSISNICARLEKLYQIVIEKNSRGR